MSDREPTVADQLGGEDRRASIAGTLSPSPDVGGALVHLPGRSPTPPAPEHDPRLSDVDEWGRSEHMREIARRLYDPIYRRLFRAEWEGLEHIPTGGGALLVANHAGAIPSDAPVIMHGIEEELGRPVYGLADSMFRGVPVVGTLWSRMGGVVAHPDNAYRLLKDQNQLVLVFPEGSKGPGKTYQERYQLRRFGRGGFVEIAMRAGVPIVPIAVVGAEESMPTLVNIPALARVLRTPYFPITANQLLFGPVLGLFAYLPAKFTLRVLPPVHMDVEPDQSRYSKSRVMEQAESIRQQIQEALYDLLKRRQSVWRG
jgi:1-acyl-sn-glycerol-3-phosphate acyltransferase